MPNKPAAGMVHLTIYLPQGLRDDTKLAAEFNGESVSEVVRRKLAEYVRETMEGK